MVEYFLYNITEELLLKIGNVEIKGKTALAPMAGVTDMAFREICREYGSSYTYTEMISAKALTYEDKKTGKLLCLAKNEHPCAVQIFGSDPDAVKKGSKLAVERSGADILDINMGCPTPKIVSNGDGSALMKNVELASRIIKAACSNVDVPVTIKMRLGWDDDHKNAVEFAKMAEDSGASAIAVHGRTRTQMYAGKADWDMIAEVKSAVTVPVIANGDVFTPEDAVSILEHTGADMCMIGRGALGCPWLFNQAEAALKGEAVPDAPSVSDRFDIAERQIRMTAEYKGEYIAMLEARKHLMWYLKGLRGSQSFKMQISKLTKIDEMCEVIESIKRFYA